METQSVRGKVKSFVTDGGLVTTEIEAKGIDVGERRISGYASKPVVDRGGDFVETRAFFNTIEKFKNNPQMLYMHNMREPIGVWDQFDLRPDGLWVSGYFVQGVPEADKAWALARQKALRALSIGFRELDAGMEEDGNYHIRDLELLEISPVTIPMNQDALFTVDKGGKLMDIKLLDPENPDNIEFFQLSIAAHLEAFKGKITEEVMESVNGALLLQKMVYDEYAEKISSLISEVRNLSAIIERDQKSNTKQFKECQDAILYLARN